ncbi:UNKNOWN [Stylonychia lemnae]|uniref:Uncharacterized protein n=1 Tax=Stylonychia lemnae TaxID=5949 RepID=A0A078AME7_STYLE|nr:UNKNOWN [Stylonychia lemnae]|eukprot:CDW83086.1 UNKNOWN [Stylonychia lemnae]
MENVTKKQKSSSIKMAVQNQESQRAQPEEGQKWNRYFDDLKDKVKHQREQIKQYDDKIAQHREKQYNNEIHQKLIDKMKQQRVYHLQRSFANQAPQKTERLYQRVQQNTALPFIKRDKTVSPTKRANHTSSSPSRTLLRGRKQLNNHQQPQIEIVENLDQNDDDYNDGGTGFFITRISDKNVDYINQQKNLIAHSTVINNQAKRTDMNISTNHYSEDQSEMFENFKLKDFLTQINRCKEKEVPIEIPGFGYNSCAYAKLVDEEKVAYDKNRKSSYSDQIFIEQQFLKSSAKLRKAENRLVIYFFEVYQISKQFEKLKTELGKSKESDYDINQFSGGNLSDLPVNSTIHNRDKSTEQQNQPLKNILKSISEINRKGIDQNIHYNKSKGGLIQQNKTSFSNINSGIQTANTTLQAGTGILGYQPTGKEFGVKTGQAFFNFNRSIMKDKIASRRQSNDSVDHIYNGD